ncbi:MAG: hypothetical protein V1760_01520 [Candidatus Peregrinibacteria bacterium]
MPNCAQCATGFSVTDRDKEYYRQINVPEPTFCPLCRQQRRFAFRNERRLYKRKCDGSGKEIITMYHPDSPYTVYSPDIWWGGNWDGTQYGRDFDFSRPFFEQFNELSKVVPRISLLRVNSENSDYCNFVGDVKNSYLIFGPVYSEDCYYGSPYYSKNCVDTLVLRDCEVCYECIDCRKLYHCFYCQDCNHSDNLLFCFDLQNCSECIGCAGLRGKKYCVFNQQLSRSEYLQRKKEIDLSSARHRQQLAKKLEQVKQNVPRLFMLSLNCQNVSGSYVFNSKNTFEAFYTDRCEDCAYTAQVVDLKNCYDNNYTEENEWCYEYLGMYGNRRAFFSLFGRHSNETYYTDYYVSCQNLFGCTNLQNKQYCILNKQYSKKDWEEWVPKIITHMQRTGEWGEFFPVKISPFAFNETVAQEYFPLSREAVLERGWKWREDDAREFQAQSVEIPERIQEVPDSICNEILACEVTGKNYRIIPQELKFYREHGLAIPRRHPDTRHLDRIAKRAPRRLWGRPCDKCHATIRTNYSPEQPEKVYCEKCYLKEIY